MATHPNASTSHHNSYHDGIDGHHLSANMTHVGGQQRNSDHLDAIFALDAPEFIATSRHGPVISEYDHANIYGWDLDWDNLVDLEYDKLEATPPCLSDKYLTVPLNENLESRFNESYMGQAGAAGYIVFDKPSAPMPNTDGFQPYVVVDAITASAPVAEDTTVPAPTAMSTANEDRIQCTWPDCNATFGRPSEMRRHLKKHLPHSFECEVEGCSKTFYRKDKLEHHHAKGHKDRYSELDQAARYQCLFIDCKMTFYDKEECLDHIKNGH